MSSRELSLASVLLPRLREQGSVKLADQLRADVGNWRCRKCAATDPVLALVEPDGGVMMACASCNRDALQRAGFAVPR